VWLRAERKAGLRLPWAYTRFVLARRFHTSPMAIDAWPAGEVAEALRLFALEGDAEAWRERAQTSRDRRRDQRGP
jgi:hypothetical protein